MVELSGLTLTVIKLGFLAVLWLFVLAAVRVMRTDLFGTRVTGHGALPPAPAAQQKPAKARRGTPSLVLVTHGPLAGTSVRLGANPITVGRSQECPLVVEDDFASSRHARLFAQDGTWFVEDLGSTNGTYIDRTKVTAPTPAPLGVPIRVGKTVLELRK